MRAQQSTADTAVIDAAAAQATADTALANGAYFRANSTGPGPQATGTDAIAVGPSSLASGDRSVAMGAGAQAINGQAVSIGAGNTASGNGAVAIGDPNTATGTGAVALGADNTATGTGAVALGNANTATGAGSVAIGNGSVATMAGSVAIGNGVTTTRVGQVALGPPSSTYTLAGISSSASRAAQSGALRLVTTDLAGNLATTDLDIGELAGLGSRVGSLEDELAALDNEIGRDLRRADGGIAAAMALGGTVMPPDTAFAVSFNLATYHGEQGFSAAAVARVTDHVWVSGGFAGSTVKGSTGGRAGVTFGW
jgi:autotransporter adhesin